MGTLTDLGLLVVGGLFAWFHYRSALETVWVRPAPVQPKSAYREAPALPLAGASRSIRFLVAYVHALSFVGAARVGLNWIVTQDLYDRGHERAHLVSMAPFNHVVQLVIVFQGFLLFLTAPRIARALAYRHPRWFGVALGAVMLGVVLAVLDIGLLYSFTRKPVIYWLVGILIDDGAYAFFGLLGVLALVKLERAETRAPPVPDAAAVTELSWNVTGVEVIVAIVALASVMSSYVYASRCYFADLEITGEVEVSTDGSPSKGSGRCFATFWMPEGTAITDIEKTSTNDARTDKVTHYVFTRFRTTLKLSCWDRLGRDQHEPFAKLCPSDYTITSDKSCERTHLGTYDRIVQNEYVVYELHAEPIEAPAARKFIDSFKPLPFLK